MDDNVPDEGWSPESVELFNKLNNLTCEEGSWKKLKPDPFFNKGDNDESVNFLRPIVKKPGHFVEYIFFVNTAMQMLKGVAQFGIHTRGLKGIVHGGAIFSILDMAMGGVIGYSERPQAGGLTVNVAINFKRALPLNTTTLVEAKIDKVEGRKGFASATIKSPTEDMIYADCTGLFILKPTGKL